MNTFMEEYACIFAKYSFPFRWKMSYFDNYNKEFEYEHSPLFMNLDV